MTIRMTTRFALAAVLLLAAAHTPAGSDAHEERATALFAGGCFWCVEEAFSKVEGVHEHVSGFAGGHVENPAYEEVVEGGTGHHEVVQVIYDPSVVSYEELLHVFWRNIDPLDAGGQFCDRGEPYQSAIFVASEAEREAATASRDAIDNSGRFDEPIVTAIREAAPFYPAEEFHQNYFEKRPLRYRFYVTACGRYNRLDDLWGEEARPGSG